MDTGTGRLTSLADSIPAARRLLLGDDEAKELRPMKREQRLAWFDQMRGKLAAQGRLPEQQGKARWPKRGRSRARRAAQRKAARA